MEKADHELLLLLSPSDERLKKLYEQHKKLEKEVVRYSHYAKYSASAALKEKELKKSKLHGMDAIMEILSDYRRQESAHSSNGFLL